MVVLMTIKEFQDKYCSLCGSLMCDGSDPHNDFPGCGHYKKIYIPGIPPYEESLTDKFEKWMKDNNISNEEFFKMVKEKINDN